MSSASSSSPNHRVISALGLLLTAVGLSLLIWLFYPAAKEELHYQLVTRHHPPSEQELTPASLDFSIVIPKLGLTAPIVKDVDPSDPTVYQTALTRGIAHAEGSGKPGEGKGIFLFAHSSTDLGIATVYNSVFYLLHQLEPGDIFSLWYQDKEYHYIVQNKEVVSASAVNYLTSPDHTLTLMTCWPPGTTLKRLLVTASSVN